MPFKVPEKFRLKEGGNMSTTALDKNNGVFCIPFTKKQNGTNKETKYYLTCIATDGLGWEHVMITVMTDKMIPVQRYATAQEMAVVKNYFWTGEETVLHYLHAAKDMDHELPYVLQLWRPKLTLIPKPPKDFKGFTGKPQLTIVK